VRLRDLVTHDPFITGHVTGWRGVHRPPLMSSVTGSANN